MMSAQGQLFVSNADTIALTHRMGRKSNGLEFQEKVWMVNHGNFAEGQCFGVRDAMAQARIYAEMEFPDCYFTPNGFHPPNWITDPVTGEKRIVTRSLQKVAKIDCLFADIDKYNSPYAHLSTGDLVQKIQKDLPDLPAPSLVMDSGRGFWLVWLLSRSLVINKTTRSKADWMPQWYACQQYLNEKLAPYGADPRAVDAARYMRLPGTENSKNGRVASAWVCVDSKGKQVFYQFTDLQRRFREEKKRPRKARAKHGRRPVAKINGVSTILTWHSLAWSRLQDFETLIKKRGGQLTDQRKRMISCYLVELANFCKTTETIMLAMDNFIDDFIADPEFYKAYYRSTEFEKIRRAEYVRAEKVKRDARGEFCRKLDFLRSDSGKYIMQENRFINTTKRAIRLLEITPEEMRMVSRRPYLATLIDANESKLRRREKNGSMPREEYEARATERRRKARELQAEGMSNRLIATALDVSRGAVDYYLA